MLHHFTAKKSGRRPVARKAVSALGEFDLRSLLGIWSVIVDVALSSDKQSAEERYATLKQAIDMLTQIADRADQLQQEATDDAAKEMFENLYIEAMDKADMASSELHNFASSAD